LAETERPVEMLKGNDLICPCCDVPRTQFGFRISFQLEIIPARFERIKHIEYEYSCPKSKGNVVSASKPYQPIDKGYAGPKLLAHVITSKMAHYLPLYRQEQIFASLLKGEGKRIARSTLSRWLKQSADEFTILWEKMCKKVLEARIIISDDTTMPFLVKGNGKAQTGYISYFGGDNEHPYNIYTFAEDGEGRNATDFLKDFFGFLLTDGSKKYNEALAAEDEDGNTMTSARCWAHVYRYFEDAKHAEEKLADYALGVIKSLFLIDSYALTLPESDCVKLRRRLSKPIIDEFKTWLDEQAFSAAPTSLLRAVNYTLGLWPGLCQFIDHGFIKLHNNDSENALRAIVLGRKNHIFAGSSAGGQTIAVLMTLVQTCKRLGIDPEEYLADVLEQMPGTSHLKIDQFLPDIWKAQREKQKASADPPENLPLSA
jgi:transposase